MSYKSLRYRTNHRINDRLARLACRTCYFAVLLVLPGLHVSFLAGCGQSENISDRLYPYYINEQTFSGQGIVYVYQPVSNPELPAEYWHYRVIHDWRGNMLKSALYDPAGMLTQESVERLESDQAELMSLELMYAIDTGTVTIVPKINERGTFPFGLIDESPATTFQIEYWDTSEDSVRVILTKQRSLVERLEYPFEGRSVPAVRVAVTETLETETQGFTETTWSGTEIYAQDIGLVYYKKEINDQFILEYSLADRMTFEQFRGRLE